MKVSDLDQDIEREQQLEALGDAIAETISTPVPGAAGPLSPSPFRNASPHHSGYSRGQDRSA